MPNREITTIVRLCALLALACAAALLAPLTASAVTLPPGFQQTTAISGLADPMDIELAANGRVFVAQKSGIIKTWASLSDTSSTTVADLRTQVHNYSARGLLSLVADPAFPVEPYIYIYYTLDAPIGGTPPTWGAPGQTEDSCAAAGSEDNCLASARVSRLRINGEHMEGPEQVLVEDWCQQFPFHSGGGLAFGADGYLYVSGGDGARWGVWDYGQLGAPANPCGDPPSGIGTALAPPTAEGGRLRAQDLRTSGDPLGLAGSLIRIDPDTGAGAPGNPRFASADPNERRMLAHGFRNPARLAMRPGTSDVWIGDRGGGYWEELDRVTAPEASIGNFGWPCYEGGLHANGDPYARIRPRSDDQELSICENLYAEVNATAAPYWAYDHERPVVSGEDCLTDPDTGEPAGNQISGIRFYPAGGSFPAAYRGALFFADRLRECMYALLPGSDGLPKRGRVVPFAQDATQIIDIEVDPDGNLLYVDQIADHVKRISFDGNSSNQAPTALATTDTAAGNRPLTVSFDGTGSSDPDGGDVLIHEWDLDGDGEFDDSTEASPQHTYLQGGTYTAALRVTDTSGASDTDSVTISVASGPVASIDTPAGATLWKAGDTIGFSGSATDEEDGTLAASALDWRVALVHCAAPGDCHDHELGTFADTASGSVTAPDHAEPGQIEIRLTATDAGGETDTRTMRLDAQTANLSLTSGPPGAAVLLNGSPVTTPATEQVVAGSTNALSVAAVQTVDNTTHRFSSWSDALPRTHSIVVPATGAARHAELAPVTPGTHTLTFTPEADARVEQGNPSANFGASNSLRTDHAPGAPEDIDSYLRFAVEGIAGRVTDAKLRLRSTGNTVDGPAVYGAESNWTENGISWDSVPASAPGPVADVDAIAAQQWVEWDVTSLVTADGPRSFRLAITGDDGVTFHSREAANQTLRPQLVVTVTNDSYARPRGATPARFPLVPAYEECTSPTHTHGPPLVHPSCNPPSQSSGELTVGNPDSNGAAANSVGSALLSVIAGNPATPEDEADVLMQVSITDVRLRSDLTDYTGGLRAGTTLRITDRADAPATLMDVELPLDVPCSPTASTGIGSTCAVSTTLDALTPGLVDEGARAVWQLGAVAVHDGGPDGDPTTPGNGVFARQGVFVP